MGTVADDAQQPDEPGGTGDRGTDETAPLNPIDETAPIRRVDETAPLDRTDAEIPPAPADAATERIDPVAAPARPQQWSARAGVAPRAPQPDETRAWAPEPAPGRSDRWW